MAQEMERILIAAAGFASIGSAIGRLHYPWKTSIYEELPTSVLKHMQLRAQMHSASSTQPTTPTPAFTNDMRERILKPMRDFLRQLEDRKRLQQDQGAVDDVGSIITGTRLAQVEDYASSMATGLPKSITVMKDITVEEMQSSDPQLTYFGRGAGPGPRLFMNVHRAIHTKPPSFPNPPADARVWPVYIWRILMDFWSAIPPFW
ncbi:hypothetical protein CF319_g869 [Tilletia indica]|nr:hypothetical protein CF319_g869 [Tilletia indica]